MFADAARQRGVNCSIPYISNDLADRYQPAMIS
jgi:hypothetical protein